MQTNGGSILKVCRQTGKIFLCLIIALGCLTGTSLADAGGYAQTGIDKFSHNYTLSGDPAEDIVRVAEAQLGKGMSDLGYTASWCAAFVNDCAKYVGAEKAIPFVSGQTHFAHELRTHILNQGGTVVATSNAKRGDIVFFDYENDGRWNHVGICTSNTATIEGNISYGGNGVYLVRRATVSGRGGSVQVVRPNYASNRAPEGYVDIANGGKGFIRVAGWARDNDTPDQNVTLHVYVGGQAGSGRTPYVIRANKYRSDLGGNYGFDERIVVSETGEQPIYVYALDTAGGSNPMLGSATVTITPNADPVGILNSAAGGIGTITVSGRVYDADTPDGPVYVHMYVGGMAGSGAPSYSITAMKSEDPSDRYCYFSSTVAVKPYGTQSIYLYAINTEYGNNPCFASKEVTITKDEVNPTISNIQISDISAGGYTITCDVSDNAGISKVAFPTWTLDKEDAGSAENQDDLFDDWQNTTLGTYSNGKASYRVKTSEHGYETGLTYVTHIYAWDVTGNYTAESSRTNVPSPIMNVQVTDVSEAGYTVSCDLDQNWGSVMKVCFPTWTVGNGQDDLDPNWQDNSYGVISGNHVTFRVLTSDHNGEKDCYYTTHIYAWKSGGQFASVTQRNYPILDVHVSNGPAITVEHGQTIGTDATAKIQLPSGTRSVSISFGRITSTGAYIDLVSASEQVSASTFTYTVPGFYMDQPGTYTFRAVVSKEEYPEEPGAESGTAEATFELVNTQLPAAPAVTVSATDFTYEKDKQNQVIFTVPGAEAIAYTHHILGYYSGEEITDGDGWISPVMSSGTSIRSYIGYIGKFNYKIWVKINGAWSTYSQVEINSHPQDNILTLPRGLKRIDSQALAGLENAEVIRIPASVEIIAEDVFDGTDCILLIPKQNGMNGELEDYCYEHGLTLMYE